jgi:error-prone DNA polymerase
MPGRVVVQWDKDDCADMGIVKVDLLGLGMMAALQDAIELVNTGTGDSGLGTGVSSPQSPAPRPYFDLATFQMNDAEVYEMLQQAETIGVFQVESRAQMATLPRLKPKHFYDLVVQVAIIRPGPIVGDMVHPYLNRRAGREPVVPLHPCLEPILARTLGVPLFQEQLLRMAMVAAGLYGRAGRGAAPRDGLQAVREAHEADRRAAARRDGAQRDYGRNGGADHQLDHVVCLVRLS